MAARWERRQPPGNRQPPGRRVARARRRLPSRALLRRREGQKRRRSSSSSRERPERAPPARKARGDWCSTRGATRRWRPRGRQVRQALGRYDKSVMEHRLAADIARNLPSSVHQQDSGPGAGDDFPTTLTSGNGTSEDGRAEIDGDGRGERVRDGRGEIDDRLVNRDQRHRDHNPRWLSSSPAAHGLL